MADVTLERMTMSQLQAHLKDLQRELASRPQVDPAALQKGLTATILAVVAGMGTVIAGLAAFLQRGVGFISGTHIVWGCQDFCVRGG
ncbi:MULTISPECIES: hypothetical protein [unclassified Rhizobacter]|uniref:hypothetical protein n=1 Tax=unclassified Rhizobacter TaxID=2640088 RepID=UPI0012FB1D06|nr:MULTISPECIES: hypothetical protein [unclassified Rhizobacter]